MSDPDTTNSAQPSFPGFPVHGLQDSARYSGQGSVRSTIVDRTSSTSSASAMTGGATKFSPDLGVGHVRWHVGRRT